MEQKLAIDFESLVSAVCEAARDYRFHDQGRVEAALDAGRHLIEAKAAVQHGDFAALLERADLKPRTAGRWMQVARLGIDADEVRKRGGIQAALMGRQATKLQQAEIALQERDEQIENLEAERTMLRENEKAKGIDHSTCDQTLAELQSEKKTLSSQLDHCIDKRAELQRSQSYWQKWCRANGWTAPNMSA